MTVERSGQNGRAAELAELRTLASKLVERIEKLQQAELTGDTEPANDADVKPTLEDFIALDTRRRKRGARRG